MPGRTAQVVEEVHAGTPLDAIDPELLDVASWQGRRRKLAEIKRRLRQTPRPVWDDLPDLGRAAQNVVLYYCCLKTYRLLFDFHMDVVLPSWHSSDRQVGSYNVRRFLEQRADRHPEIDRWSDGTWDKVRQVTLKMLRESGLLKDEHLQRVRQSDGFWQRFVKVGDVWYLEATFLNERKRRSVVDAVRS